MKHYKLLLLAILCITSLFAESNQKISLQLLWKHQFEFAGFYMAKEKGFYNNAGLDVEFKEYKIGSNISQDVASGKVDFGIGYSGIILDKIKGDDIKLLNAIYQSSPHVLVSLESSKIKSIKDFKGKKISMTNSHTKTANIKSMIYSQKISLDDMKIEKFEYGIDALLEGRTDLQSIYLSNEIFKLNEKNIPYNIWDPKDYGFSFYDNILFTSTKLITKNPQLVKDFQKASLRGWEYAFKNIDETIDVILKKYNTQHKTKKALLYEANELKKLAYYETPAIGKIEESKIQRIIDIYNLMGLIENNIPISDFIYDPSKKKIILTNEEKNYLKTNPIITVHNEIDWAPFNYYENNTPKGFSIDYINLLAKKLNLNIKYITGPTWSEFIKIAKDGKIDIILNVVDSEERRNFLNFTDPYKNLKQSLFTNLDNIHSLEELNGKSIATTKGFYIEKFLKENYPNIKLHSYNSTLECIYSVIEGKSDALIEDFLVVSHLFQKHNLSIKNVKINIDNRLNFNLRIGVNKNKPILHNLIQKAQRTVTQEELNKLSRKWTIIEKIDYNKPKIELSKREQLYLKNKNITMCIDPNWMPFEKIEKGKHIGISKDYFTLFEKNLGKKISLIPTETWEQSLEYAKQRKCDILSLAMETPQRKEYMNFTTPYLSVPLVIATKNNVTFINDIKTLKDKKIGIPRGYAFVEIFKEKYPFLNIIEVDTLEEGLQQVKNNELFGYIGTLASVGYMFQTKFTGELKIAGKFDEKWELGIGVRNDDTILLDIMEKVIQSIDKTQSQSILNNWLAVKYEQKFDYTFLWQILSVIALIIILIIYRQIILRKANKDLQKKVDKKTNDLIELNKNLELKIQQAIEENTQKDRLLYNQSKMASMGEMIANISHQWRQPLSIISTVASGMKMKLEYDIFDKDEEVKNLDVLLNSTKYLSNTIDDFKNFLSPVKTNKPFNIKTIIDKVIQMFGKNFTGHSIEIIINTEDLEAIGNENELLQVIINILNNSKDILNAQELKKKLIFIDLHIENNTIVLSIKDNGGGIPKDILPNIFDAYFTTKHKSMGTGIGLYMSYQIIKNSFDGDIIASNEEFIHENTTYIGAKFSITFPLKSED